MDKLPVVPSATEDERAAAFPGDASPPPNRLRGIGPFTLRQLALVSAVAGFVAIVLFSVTRPLDARGQSTASPGTSFYLIGPQSEGLEIGRRAPDFAGLYGDRTIQLTNLDGEELRLTDYAGRPVWVVFWATWCPPCQQETPDIRAAYEDHRNDGLVVLAIDVQEPAEIVSDYVNQYSLGYTIGLDTHAAVMKTYGVFGLPTHYFIDRGGVIRDRYLGPLTRQQMEERIIEISGS